MISEKALKAKIKPLIGLVLIGAILLLAYEVFYWLTHVYESDAQVQTEFTIITSGVDGKIEEVFVAEGHTVSKGQLLATQEHDDIELNIKALETDLALEEGNRNRLRSERGALEEEIRTKVATQLEKISSLEVEHASISDRLLLARKDLSRMRVLVGKQLRPESLLIAEQDKTLVLEGKAALLQAQIGVARGELDQLHAAKQKLTVIDNAIEISFIQATKIRDDIRKQELLLTRRHIRSPIDGVVGKIYRYTGQYVEDATSILMLHDPKLYWIEAYVDESEIRHVRIGQEVIIDLDAYPFEDFYGTVQQIGNVTIRGADNGNAGRSRLGGAVERVPVRISIDSPPPNITPGMRGKVNIRIYDNIKLWSR
jgi:membrane fusion protein (multidrug efflux system)